MQSPKTSGKQLKDISCWQTLYQAKDHVSHTADPTSCAQADLRRNQPRASSSRGAAQAAGEHRNCTHGPVTTLSPCHDSHTGTPGTHSSAAFTEASLKLVEDPLCATATHCPLLTPEFWLAPQCWMLSGHRAVWHSWDGWVQSAEKPLEKVTGLCYTWGSIHAPPMPGHTGT